MNKSEEPARLHTHTHGGVCHPAAETDPSSRPNKYRDPDGPVVYVTKKRQSVQMGSKVLFFIRFADLYFE